MDNLLRVSVIIPTRDRPKDLANLLLTILNQNHPPIEVIIVDDSPKYSAKPVTYSYSSIFESAGYKLKYLKGSGDGLPASRNLGVKHAKGDAILFLDDDTLLSDKNVIKVLADFLKKNSHTLGVQPLITSPTECLQKKVLTNRLENAIYKVFMLTYHKDNKLAVRRSGASIFPNSLTKVIQAQRLSGCCCCFRREVFNQLSFDTNLKRWGFMEDLDFSLRVYKKYKGGLYAIPNARIFHKVSEVARLPTKTKIHMSTIYWFYVFFKDIFEGSLLNLTALVWALMGNLVVAVGGLIIKKKPRQEWWTLIYLLESYVMVFRNLKYVLMRKLDFFNKNLR